ncbi:MAG: inorganic pyrophosphatase Ppa [Desulfobacteraceae bacterium]
MPIINFLKLKERFEVQKYKRPKTMDRENCISFSGSPRKHPDAGDKLILIVDPFSTNTSYYVFRIKDIGFAEELPSITNIEGESVTMARLWINRRSKAVQCTPFVVEKIPMG